MKSLRDLMRRFLDLIAGKKGRKDHDFAQKYAPAFLQDTSDLHCKLLLWRAGVEGCSQVKKDVTQRLCFGLVSSLCANFFQT